MRGSARRSPGASRTIAEWPGAALSLLRRIVMEIEARRRRARRRRLLERMPDCLVLPTPTPPRAAAARPRPEDLWRAGDLAGDW